MNEVSINKQAKLSEHFKLGELTKTKHVTADGNIPSHEVIENLKSNHVTGCAVDIRCVGKEQMIRYACILLDIADGTDQVFDELLLEQHGNICWLHFAVRPPSQQNRRRIGFLRP